jgi:hypothetical protein
MKTLDFKKEAAAILVFRGLENTARVPAHCYLLSSSYYPSSSSSSSSQALHLDEVCKT